MTKLLLSLSIVFASVIISSCTSLRLSTPMQTQYQKQSPQARYHALSKIKQWHIDGAFSIQQPTATNTKSIIANYDWQQSNQNYTLSIYSSLHIYNAQIIGNGKQVSLIDENNQKHTANTPEALMQQQLGWSLPLSDLFYWIRGLPAPGAHQSKTDGYGHLIQLQQGHWTVHFSRYVSRGPVDLPQILQLNNGRFAVKIVIKHWQAA